MKDTVDLLRAFAACFAILCPAAAGAQEAAANVAIQWNQAALQGVRDSKLSGRRPTCTTLRRRLPSGSAWIKSRKTIPDGLPTAV